MGRKGVVGEILVIIVLLASVFLIVQTFTETEDTPNIAADSLEGLRDVRSVLAKAILDWLHAGVVHQPLACNGQYYIQPNDPAFIQQLIPFVENELSRPLQDTERLQVEGGDLKDITFIGLDSLQITLANGSIIYNDTSIYAETGGDKDYLFNVRLPLVLTVAQDWVKCDSGNMSRKLEDAFGAVCFYGVKSKNYPGCPKNDAYTLTNTSKAFISNNAITPEHVGIAAQSAIDELNEYFNGTKSCAAPPVSDTGITCSYELQDVEFYNYIHPYSSDMIALSEPPNGSLLSAGDLIAMAERSPDLEFDKFIRQDKRVYALPAEIISYPYTDSELADPPNFECTPQGRTPVNTVLAPVTYPQEQGMIQLKDENGSIGRPVLYVNTTRGAKFTLVVTCRDNRVSLLGQPLEYTFKVRHGIKQHCGPRYMGRGTTNCMGCAPKPNILDKCETYGHAKGCTDYYGACRDKVLWSKLYSDQTLESPPSNVDALLLGDQDIFNEVCQRCHGVMGSGGNFLKEDECPPEYEPVPNNPRFTRLVCNDAYAGVCCGTEGFNETCSPAMSLGNSECFMGITEYKNWCVVPKECGSDECNTYACVSDTGECQATPKQNKCEGGCGECVAENGKGVCKFTAEAGDPCSDGWQDSKCNKDVCDPEIQGCANKLDPDQLGDTCGQGDCGREICISTVGGRFGSCEPDPADTSRNGDVCGSDSNGGVCYKLLCEGGLCKGRGETISCGGPDPPDPKCNPACPEGKCQC